MDSHGHGMRRAAVTGIGVLCPVGLDRHQVLDAVRTGRSGIAAIEQFDPSPFRTRYGGEVRGFDPREHLSPDELERFPDPSLRLALAAARQALHDAGLSWTRQAPPARAAIVVGTCNGGLKSAEEQYAILNGLAPGRFDRRMNLLIRYHALGKALSHSLGVTGPTWVVTTACASSTGALGVAQELLSHGLADTVLAGGVDALCLAAMAGFDALKATSTERTAPFSLPVGLNLGEGAAFWVLEELDAARARGARIDGEVLGYAFTADAHHPTAPDPRGDGAYRTMTQAIARAGLSAAELGCINAHGTGTEVNDRIESKAIARLVGDSPVPVHSFKSAVGHCLGAAGIIEATAGLVAMNDGLVPATINFGEPRPGCTLDYVPGAPRPAAYDRFLSCNYAFGGNNAGVVVGRCDPSRPPAAGPDPTARTVLTGGGAVTSLGLGSAALLEALREGRRGLVPVGRIATRPTRSKLAGLVPEFDGRDVDRRLDLKSMNPISRYAAAAARLAMADADLRVGPKDGLDVGVVTGVYVGPCEEGHMHAITRSRGAQADISGFSVIVANATSGWVSNALLLKGYACTVSQGADAGLFALLLAHLAVTSREAPCVLAGASDELYSRYFRNCDELDLLHTGDDEVAYGLRLDIPDRRVVGEGAAYVVAEDAARAKSRGARILATIAGYGMTTDTDAFYEPCARPEGLARAIRDALAMAGWSPGDVGLVLWSPEGNSGDRKTLAALEIALGASASRVPLVTSVFHTGLAEAASGTATLAAVLRAWSDGGGLWPQLTGVSGIDGRELPAGPVPTLAIATSELGFNLALALAPGE
ncbi:MAG: beta-ketoacyl-[acyl-carrier-protein] synthase family protein [Deltaproteobacteria bacterium]|nr:beta-ketoacyl-[acyl-carrier-protein] synthase family protein [Deltaproteobacteria bacterium]